MKFVASVLLSSAVAQAAHLSCANATVVMDGMAYASEFKDADTTVDSLFAEPASTRPMYRDQYFKYTATCNGVGLVQFEGNGNFTSTTVDVWSGGCAAPLLRNVSSGSSSYTAADMINVTLLFSSAGSSGASNRLQYLATNGTEYIIRVGTYNDVNNTGEFGNFEYSLTAACVTPASNDPVNPTMVMGNMTYYKSNVNGSAVDNSCGNGNSVFFGYTAECTGDISFIIVKDPRSGSFDGFHGEDLEIGVYNYSLTGFDTSATGGPDACQDDPAMISIYRNLSQVPARTINGDDVSSSVKKVEGGIVKDKKYLIQVSSYRSGSAVAPFTLLIDGPYNCPKEGDAGGTSSAAALVLSGFSVAMMLSM